MASAFDDLTCFLQPHADWKEVAARSLEARGAHVTLQLCSATHIVCERERYYEYCGWEEKVSKAMCD
jgi:hypothetical protein